ncbi:MAG: hypothetical protein H5T84_09495 [Thermoleophilia bacterium]|nr:hypothetical protein [Thermoleophilia bacterium]
MTEALWAEHEAFATRDLSETVPLQLFFDGVAERLEPGQMREAVLSRLRDHLGEAEGAHSSRSRQPGVD